MREQARNQEMGYNRGGLLVEKIPRGQLRGRWRVVSPDKGRSELESARRGFHDKISRATWHVWTHPGKT